MALRVAHLIAQNARHQTDTDLLDRHTGLNPRALTVQIDTPDEFLWSGGPKVGSSDLVDIADALQLTIHYDVRLASSS